MSDTNLLRVIILIYGMSPQLVREKLEHIFLPESLTRVRRHFENFAFDLSTEKHGRDTDPVYHYQQLWEPQIHTLPVVIIFRVRFRRCFSTAGVLLLVLGLVLPLLESAALRYRTGPLLLSRVGRQNFAQIEPQITPSAAKKHAVASQLSLAARTLSKKPFFDSKQPVNLAARYGLPLQREAWTRP